LAAKDIGKHCTWFGLPLISGFLLTGVLAGPYMLGMLDNDAVAHLRFIDAFALAFIAFAAGGELELSDARRYLRSIIAVITGLTLVVFVFGTITYVVLADRLPFMQGMSRTGVLAVAFIGATIMVARSPSSAYDRSPKRCLGSRF
jgi:Kef-type K+ transport system membrane component KefB